MEKAWPPLKECFQFKNGMMRGALRRYPWEDDGYAFDFNNYYPPIPDELACLRKLLDSVKRNNFRPSFPEDTKNCPFCPLRPDVLGPKIVVEDEEILNHPVWDMDPIPCPVHLFRHIWPIGEVHPALVTPQQLENTKRYLKQVRNSRGYDVDCAPHPILVPLVFVERSKTELPDAIKGRLESALIEHIELKTNKKYELDKILKIVSANIFVYFVTFTAKVKNDDSAASETFIAAVTELNRPDANHIMECLLKPDCDAPGPDHYPDYEIHPYSMPFSMRSNMRSCCNQFSNLGGMEHY